MKNQLNIGLLVLRITLGILFILHGIAKLKSGVSGMQGMFESKGLPGFIAYAVYIGEVLAPIMLLLGLPS